MGFYDSRCMLTGVSLWPNDAVLVVLEAGEGGENRPIALGVRGCPNRLGSIDGLPADANVSALAEFFAGQFRTGALPLDEYAPAGTSASKDLERVFQAFERNMNNGAEHYLAGRPLSFALLAIMVWDGIVERAPREGTPAELFGQLFGPQSLARAIYPADISAMGSQIAQLAAVNAFLGTIGARWSPSTSDGGQHSDEEMRAFVEEARERFRNSPVMLNVLDSYAEDLEEAIDCQ